MLKHNIRETGQIQSFPSAASRLCKGRVSLSSAEGLLVLPLVDWLPGSPTQNKLQTTATVMCIEHVRGYLSYFLHPSWTIIRLICSWEKQGPETWNFTVISGRVKTEIISLWLKGHVISNMLNGFSIPNTHQQFLLTNKLCCCCCSGGEILDTQ